MGLTALLFLLAYTLGCLLAFIRHPVFGLLTYVAVFYLNPQSRWWGGGFLQEVRWSYIAGLVTLVAIAFSHHKLRPSAGFMRESLVLGFVAFLAWIAIQSFWAYDPDAHFEFLSYCVKFLVVVYLIYRCVDNSEHLTWFLWSHVLGCFYLGWIAYTDHSGGRFEGFGGPGIGEANAGALQLVTGALVAVAMFLGGKYAAKLSVVAVMPLIVNAIVSTASRSGFLAFVAGGLVFNLFTPKRFRATVGLLSVLGLVLFAALTSDFYWTRMGTLKYRGAEVENVDTGAGRLEIIAAQWRMFEAHPFGCGHMCTTVLSPSYLDERHMSDGARASHNTFMTMLVDHGMPGGLAYVAVAFWSYRRLRSLLRRCRDDDSVFVAFIPGVAASLCAVFVADLFVQYPKFEARFWFLAVVMVLTAWASPRINATVDRRVPDVAK